MSTSEEARTRLVEIIRARSLITGGALRLASGRESHFYVNLKPTMMDPEGAALIARLVYGEAARLRAEIIGGLEMGAVPLTAAVVAYSADKAHPMRGVFMRKSVKGHGTGALVEGLAAGETLDGCQCLILEDVTTTGGSALRAVEMARKAGGRVSHVLTLVDRCEGAEARLLEAGLALVSLLTAADILGE